MVKPSFTNLPAAAEGVAGAYGKPKLPAFMADGLWSQAKLDQTYGRCSSQKNSIVGEA